MSTPRTAAAAEAGGAHHDLHAALDDAQEATQRAVHSLSDVCDLDAADWIHGDTTVYVAAHLHTARQALRAAAAITPCTPHHHTCCHHRQEATP